MTTIYFSPSTKSFFSTEIHSQIPEDKIEITKEYYDEIFQGLSSGGKIVFASGGYPIIEFPAYDQSYALIEAAKVAVQKHMDDKARSKGYDNIASAVTYAEEDSVPSFQAEGIAFRKWRSLVWAACYSIMEQAANGDIETPDIEYILNTIPTFEGV